MSGHWVFVCGPSGAGKDSVMGWAAAALAHEPRISFARRLVTRAAAPGAGDEELGAEAFGRRLSQGGLAWHWRAHGHDYGIAAAYAQQVATGGVVVVNGSREHVAGLGRRPGHLKLVLVTAPADRVASRLKARGREDATAIEQRIARNGALAEPEADLVLRNDGELAAAGHRLRTWLLSLL
jgi:phosphonate metabolism protein PhnN/1,5-bisphosphokinase (PRPP-forming)